MLEEITAKLGDGDGRIACLGFIQADFFRHVLRCPTRAAGLAGFANIEFQLPAHGDAAWCRGIDD
jgi:hypothetical protein